MTDIIGAIQTAVNTWNDENKCGYCWEFTKRYEGKRP